MPHITKSPDSFALTSEAYESIKKNLRKILKEATTLSKQKTDDKQLSTFIDEVQQLAELSLRALRSESKKITSEENETTTAKEKLLPKGIRLKANGSYQVDVMVKGVRKTGTASTFSEAQVLRKTLKSNLQTVTVAPEFPHISSAWTFRTAMRETQILVWNKGKNSKAHIYSRAITNYFGQDTPLDRIWGDKINIGKISLFNVNEFIEYCRAQGNTGATINRKLSALSVMLNTALSQNKLGDLMYIPKLPRQPENSHSSEKK